ncbi:MAG: transposase [Thermoleophilaceae bacterium]|nr:transposase [Thermoleophilaceae bacterium]
MQMVCLDDLVPADDELRRIEALIDWEHVRATARPFYRPGGAGRLGTDPAVLVKLALVLAWRGLPSMRAVLKMAATDMSIRRFLGFGLTERLPDHSTFSHAQTQRFADSSVFEQLFTAVLRQCTEAGLVGGRRLLVDATHVEADAALKSLRAELSPVEDSGDGEGGERNADVSAETPASRPELALAEPRTGPTPKRTASNATAVSRSDPDAKLRHKPGHRTHLVHRAQVAVDPKARVIVAVEAERATGSEADALGTLIGRARFAGHAAREIGADAGYASQASYTTLGRLKATALIPPQPGARHDAARAARARMRTPVGRDTAIDRQTHAEGAIAELKHHGMTRARCRGTRRTQLQLLAAATAINLKRLLTAHSAQADTQTGHSAPNYPAITGLLDLLTHCLAEIARLTATESSTGS